MKFALGFILFTQIVAAAESDLMNDLLIVDQINCRLNDRVPTYYNHLLQGGYFNMPSALMGDPGELGAGYTYLPPYRLYNLRLQYSDRLEFSGNYRVFVGVDDENLTCHGFGDFSDKGMNIKIALLKPEESEFRLPGFAIGWEDVLGTRAFRGFYLVATQVSRPYNFECSLGYGIQRIRGFFGGFTWFPFRTSCNSYINGFALCAEYDAIPYHSKKREPHPDGRESKSKINFGVKYRLWNWLDMSASYVRGKELALSSSVFYNFGCTQGFLAKTENPLPYTTPINTHPLGCLRPDDVFVQELHYAFDEQGFLINEVRLSTDRCSNTTLTIKMVNNDYRYERDVRCRLNSLLAGMIPNNIDHVVVVVEGKGFPIEEYHFPMYFVRLYKVKEVGPYELRVVSPICNVTPPRPSSTIYFRNRDLYNFAIFPKNITFFGSAEGKFKYALGAHLNIDGYLWNDVYYNFLFGYIGVSNLYNLRDVDKLNPSQLPNVRTDIVNYLKQDGLTVDVAYFQKNWNVGKGWYSRVAFGIFEVEYGGIANEVLWYPVDSPFAFGVEASIFRKRTYKGLGFTNDVRQLHGYVPYFHKYFFAQYFLSAYYHFYDLDIDIQLKAGKFLANDWGIRTEISHYFPSGMRIYYWYTFTNGHDVVNGQIYYDKGIAISLPIDIFLKHSSKKRWNYGMSAWLRDVGISAENGLSLYRLIQDLREK